MLSILVLSHKGEGYEIANRIKQEGYLSKFWVEHPENFHGVEAKGFQVDRYEEHIEAADLVVACSSRHGRLVERLRERGKAVVGGGVCELLTQDVGFALSTARLLNLELSPPEQEGVEAIFGGWFLGNKWGPTYGVQEYNRLLDGERGPRTIGMGALVWQAPSLLNDLTSFLTSTSYHGFLGVKIVLTEQGPHFNGFTTDLTGCMLPAIVEQSKTRLAELLVSVAYSRTMRQIKDFFGLSLRVLTYNSSKLRVTDQMRKHVWQHQEADSVGYISAGGDTIREARRRLNRTAGNAATLDQIYRSDIGYNNIFEQGAHHAITEGKVETGLRDECIGDDTQLQANR